MGEGGIGGVEQDQKLRHRVEAGARDGDGGGASERVGRAAAMTFAA
jgi:hypothetical protein